MAHEIHDDGFHEIQLSGKQLVFLFMATTVVSIVIFLCGVLVGRGVQNARGSVAEAVGLDASASTGGGEADSASLPTTGEPTSVVGLSYPENLTAKDGEPPRVEAGAAAEIAPPVTAPPAPPAAVEVKTPPAPTPAPTEAPKAVAPPKDVASPAPAPAPAGDGGFTVQVTALKNKPEADAIAQRLQTRGYKAYVLAPTGGGQVIYKVRVGMNMQRPEADKVMRRLQSEEKFKPWITR
ncbi:SPOR domain-containing protein [Luteitalea sp.]|uniref:SPOR domain-containing protein n=1 Tax=Luteitalea sp. TaxID=2004800 RepID=UPI0025C72BDA|nr:SPOR domain-containing protein [Luteitalea sp.]